MKHIDNSGDAMLKAMMVLFVLIFLIFATIGVARATNEKVYVCHRVAGWGQNHTGYNLLQVSDAATQQAHVDGAAHNKPVWNTKFKMFLDDYIPTAYEIQNGCGATEPPPPPPPIETYVVSADIIICQDPRAYITLTNDSSVPREFLVRWTSAKDKEIKWVGFIVQADSERLITRWVLGQTIVKVWGEEDELLARARVDRATNVGACPA